MSTASDFKAYSLKEVLPAGTWVLGCGAILLLLTRNIVARSSTSRGVDVAGVVFDCWDTCYTGWVCLLGELRLVNFPCCIYIYMHTTMYIYTHTIIYIYIVCVYNLHLKCCNVCPKGRNQTSPDVGLGISQCSYNPGQ